MSNQQERIAVSVPRGLAAIKPAHGAPCNRCGICCMARPCDLGQHVFLQEAGRCPALERDDDGLAVCGLVAHPEQYPAPRGSDPGSLRAAAMILINAVALGRGCDARIEGEARDDAYESRMALWDVRHVSLIRAAWRIWGGI